MRTPLKHALIAFLLLWLPLQNAAALALPVCSQMLGGRFMAGQPAHEHAAHRGVAGGARDQALAADASQPASHHTDHTAHDRHDVGLGGGHDGAAAQHATTHLGDHDAVAATDASAAGDDSGLCHLACASALTGTAQRFEQPPSASPEPAQPLKYPSHTPPLLQRPPLSA
jgi:hypothetical protein